MSEFIKTQEEARANLTMQIREVIDGAEADSRGLDSAELQKIDRIESDIRKADEALEVARRSADRLAQASEASRLSRKHAAQPMFSVRWLAVKSVDMTSRWKSVPRWFLLLTLFLWTSLTAFTRSLNWLGLTWRPPRFSTATQDQTFAFQ